MGNAVSSSDSAEGNVNDDEIGEEDARVLPIAAAAAAVSAIQRRTSSSKLPLHSVVVPRRLSQRPGCTITLKNIGCKITCKSTKKKMGEKKRREFPFDEPDEEIGPGAVSSEQEEEEQEQEQEQQQQQNQNKKYFEKTILANVTGVISPGLWAIMGPSGAGKSTLLDIITRRKTEGIISGSILLDGKPSTTLAIKKYASYVAQQDIFYGGSTVFETLLFAAMIKIPVVEKLEKQSVYEQVEQVIQAMDLEKCRNTYLGNALVRGVSGGEKKRVSIASVLLSQPRCMFLDEPTSGLDSQMAREVMMCLADLQRR